MHVAHPASLKYSFIDATALQDNFILVTRHSKDFENFGIKMMSSFD